MTAMRAAFTVCLILTSALLIACGGGRPPTTATASKDNTKDVPNQPPRGKTSEVAGVRMTIGKGGWISNNFESAMSVEVEIDNQTEGKRLRFTGWRPAELRDQFGTQYACHGSWAELSQPRNFRSQVIDPGQKRMESLHFEVPTDKATSFDLDIPGECVGHEGMFRLHFDRPAKK